MSKAVLEAGLSLLTIEERGNKNRVYGRGKNELENSTGLVDRAAPGILDGM